MAIDCLGITLQRVADYAIIYLSQVAWVAAFGEYFTLTGEECMEHATTVFIADSAEDFCAGLSAALQRAGGFQVVGTANDGEQAIRMVTQLRPDILVLDLMLSKQDGISVLKNLAGMEHTPITLATSCFVSQYVSNVVQLDRLGFCKSK